MSSALFIINPAAGHGRAGRAWAALKDAALRLVPDAACAVTESAGHAAELARAAAEDGVSKIIAVGGDGTFCEALEGLMGASERARSRAALGAVPAGSGCDLARHLGYPKDRDGLIALLARGGTRRIDVGLASFAGGSRRRHFINIAAFGLGGDVARRVAASGKPLGGTLSYAFASLAALAAARARPMRLVADGAPMEGRWHLGVLANTSSMGGGMLIAPGAVDDDGEMELVLAGDMSRAALLAAMPSLYRGRHIGRPGIEILKVKRLECSSREPVSLNIDGEADGAFPAVFEVLPKAVSVITPERK